MNEFEEALKSIANGAEEVHMVEFWVDLESVRRLMAACSAASSVVVKLKLVDCGLDDEAVEVIASSPRSSVLLELSLDYNFHIGLLGAQALAEMLCVNTALKELSLFKCHVGDKGAGHLAVALRQNRTLEDLFLGSNNITHIGAAALAAVLPFNQTLRRLQLDNNPLGNDGVKTLLNSVPVSGLRKLWLREAQFGKRGCAALVEMLKNGSRLQTLGIDNNHWPALEEGFRCNWWLLDHAPEQYLERNKAMHLQARKSVYTLLLIRKLLSSFPKEVVREITQFVYSSRGEISVWQANKQ
jgi:Ran GTPase-activating protein (RanGAP) involved in mRNA processing and transport